jgi:zinc protease
VSFRIGGSPQDLEMGFKLVYALLTDGTIEDSAIKVWKQRQEQQLTMLQRMPDYRAYEALVEAVYGNDPRMAPLLPKDRIDAIETPAVQSWFDQLRQNAPIEVAVVGEIQRDEAMKLVAKYLGSLSKRAKNATRLDALRTLKRGKGPWTRSVEVDTQTPRAMAIAGFLGCEESQVYDARALELAAHVLSSRLIEEIRENKSLVYSLQASNSPSTAYHDAGIFFTQAPCEVGTAPTVVQEVNRVFDAFRDKGPTDKEMSNAVKQIENNLDEDLREPSYWLRVLRDLHYHGRNLQDEKDEPTAYRKYSTDDVKKVFSKYYTSERRFDVTATPISAPTDETPATSVPDTPTS